MLAYKYCITALRGRFIERTILYSTDCDAVLVHDGLRPIMRRLVAKVLGAVAASKPLLNERYLADSLKAGHFLDTTNYVRQPFADIARLRLRIPSPWTGKKVAIIVHRQGLRIELKLYASIMKAEVVPLTLSDIAYKQLSDLPPTAFIFSDGHHSGGIVSRAIAVLHAKLTNSALSVVRVGSPSSTPMPVAL